MFSEAITLLNKDPEARGNFAAEMIRRTPTPADYHLAMHLPEENRTDYAVDNGAMAVYPTMAGLSGMDSSYAPVGAVSASKFLEETAKITAQTLLTEKQIRQIQDLARRAQIAGGNTTSTAASEIVGFTQMLLVAHWDTAEFLRGQAIFTGGLNFVFNGKAVVVDYGVPAENKYDTRTGVAAYDKAESTFWADVRAARRQLGYAASFETNYKTFYGIIDNPFNAVRAEEVTAESAGDNRKVQTFRLTKRVGDNVQASDDFQDSVTFSVYQNEGSVLDPTAPNGLAAKQVVPDGKIAVIGDAGRAVYRVGRGAAPDLTNRGGLGYYHVAPTVEGNAPGRWARVFTPEGQPMQVVGQSASNELPVIESPERLVILSSEIGA